MVQLPYVLCYAALLVFTVAVVARSIVWSRLPMHIRWELYPVAHEPSEKALYGGSFMEESDWWNKPRRTSTWGKIKAMAAEIFLLLAVRENNRSLWTRTFPFHFGLYLAGGSAGLAILCGIVCAFAPGLFAGTTGEVLRVSVLVPGVSGLTLGVVGALSLLHRRLTVPALKRYTRPADLFNLTFFVVAFGCALCTFVVVDPKGDKALLFAANLASFHMDRLPGAGLEAILPMVTTVLLSLLIAYIPLTHMSHFVVKYFAYHAIRWNDEPNLPGGPQEAIIRELLGRKVTWAAQHIRGDGNKTWAEAALENPAKGAP